MKLEEVRQKIDAIDPQIRELLMERLDCSRLVAETKQAAGETNIYRPDREQVILQKLSQGVSEDRLPEYLAVVRKITTTMKGTIRAEANQPHGLKICMTFPLEEDLNNGKNPDRGR